MIAFHYKGLYSALLHASVSFKETIYQSLRSLIFLPNYLNVKIIKWFKTKSCENGCFVFAMSVCLHIPNCE